MSDLVGFGWFLVGLGSNHGHWKPNDGLHEVCARVEDLLALTCGGSVDFLEIVSCWREAYAKKNYNQQFL